MVKSAVGAASRGSVGAAPLFEDVLDGNFSYPDVPGTQPTLDKLDNSTRVSNPMTGYNRGVANWAYPSSPTLQATFDMGDLTNNLPTSFVHGHTTRPFNASARGLGTRADKKIRRPWNWPPP